MSNFVSRVELPVSIEDAFDYHQRHGALQRLIPPWEKVIIEASDDSLQVGSKVRLRTSVLGLPARWTAEHLVYEPPTRFVDVARSGPFKSWHHEHLFQSLEPMRTLLTDQIAYELPVPFVPSFLENKMVRQRLQAMFAYRHEVTREDLRQRVRHQLPSSTIGITGATGLVGQELLPFLSLMGHQPVVAKRHEQDGKTTFRLRSTTQQAVDWQDCDTVIHLAGKSIADQRWSPGVKQQIRDSRVLPTRWLAETLAGLPRKPKLLVCASAIGIYGDRGDEPLTESAASKQDFLGAVAEEWEAACEPARQAGIRVVNLRFGVILSPRGGALAKMLTPAGLGLGGALGSGKQWWSWIAMDDVLGAIYHAIAETSLEGPVNLVAPEPVTNQDFASILGKVLSRPAVIPAPAPVLRFVLGEMADALLLSSTRVSPQRLIETDYRFRFPSLENALRHLLGRGCPAP